MDVVVRVEVIPLRVPYPSVRRFGRHALAFGENILVRLTTSQGLIGLGEAVPRPYVYGESQVSIVHALQEWLAPAVLGRSAFDTNTIHAAWDLVAYNWAAKAGLDMALADLRAQAIGLPLYRYLGGGPSEVPLTWILTYATEQELVDQAERWAAAGFRTFKVKVGPDVRRDRRHLERLRESIGKDARIYVDANGTFTNAEALGRMEELADLGVWMVEDPIRAPGYGARSRLAAASRLPILADESAKSIDEGWLELSVGGASFFSIKIFRTGILRSLDLLAAIAAAGRAAIAGGQGETALGAVIAAHFAAANHLTADHPAEVSASLAHEFSVVAGGLPVTDGSLQLPDAPGIGVELDESVLRRMAVSVWQASSRKAGWHAIVTAR